MLGWDKVLASLFFLSISRELASAFNGVTLDFEQNHIQIISSVLFVPIA